MMYNPHQYQCSRCVMLGKDCSKLDFKSMKQVGIYKGVAILVKCTEYVKRER